MLFHRCYVLHANRNKSCTNELNPIKVPRKSHIIYLYIYIWDPVILDHDRPYKSAQRPSRTPVTAEKKIRKPTQSCTSFALIPPASPHPARELATAQPPVPNPVAAPLPPQDSAAAPPTAPGSGRYATLVHDPATAPPPPWIRSRCCLPPPRNGRAPVSRTRPRRCV